MSPLKAPHLLLLTTLVETLVLAAIETVARGETGSKGAIMAVPAWNLAFSLVTLRLWRHNRVKFAIVLCSIGVILPGVVEVSRFVRSVHVVYAVRNALRLSRMWNKRDEFENRSLMENLAFLFNYHDISTRFPVKDYRASVTQWFGKLIRLAVAFAACVWLYTHVFGYTFRDPISPHRPHQVYITVLIFGLALVLLDEAERAGALLAGGYELPPTFDFDSILTRCSIQDFWSRRWNRQAGKDLQLGVFDPLVGRRGVTREAARLVTFLASFALHAVPLLMTHEDSRSAFSVFVFFALQPLLVGLERRFKLRDNLVWVHGCFFLTFPLFINPYLMEWGSDFDAGVEFVRSRVEGRSTTVHV